MYFFSELFLTTKRLEPEIPTGEKGIVADGHVNVYQNVYNEQTDHSLTGGNLVGQLKLQVKGKRLPKTKNYLTSFELHRYALENIKTIGGLVLLVAGLPRDERKETIPYYADLSVQNVELFLSQMGRNQATFNVPLQRFPTDPNEIYRYVYHLTERQSENCLITPDDTMLENAEGFTITLPHSVDLSRPQLFGGPTSSAIIKMIGPDNRTRAIKAMLKITPESYQLRRWEDMEVSCGETTYSETRRRKVKGEIIEFYLSPGICLSLDPTSDRQTNHMRYQSNLHYALNDLLFMDALCKGTPIQLNGIAAFEFKASRSGKLKEFLEPLDYFLALTEMCEDLGIDPKLCRVADLSESAAENLRDVCLCHSGKASFTNKQAIPLRHELDLGAGKILLLWVKDDETGRWVPTSFFDTTKHVFAVTQQNPNTKHKQLVPVTPYDFIPFGELGDVLNLRPDLLVPAYEKLVGDFVVSQANQTVLSLIASADKTPHRRNELLTMASDLNRWTIEQDKDCLYYTINSFQIKKRLGTFTDSDREAVHTIWMNAGRQIYGVDSLSIETGTSILLDKTEGIDYLLGKMGESDREFFKTLPIYFFHQIRGCGYVLGSPNNEADWSRIEKRIMDEEVEETVKAINRR